MSLVALVLAAQAAAPALAPSASGPGIRVLSADGQPVSVELETPGGASAQLAASETPNLYQVPARCRDVPYQVLDQFGRPMATRLADLPQPGGLQLLVDRSVQGCRVITVKRGVVARDQPNPPREQYRIRPLDERSRRR